MCPVGPRALFSLTSLHYLLLPSEVGAVHVRSFSKQTLAPTAATTHFFSLKLFVPLANPSFFFFFFSSFFFFIPVTLLFRVIMIDSPRTTPSIQPIIFHQPLSKRALSGWATAVGGTSANLSGCVLLGSACRRLVRNKGACEHTNTPGRTVSHTLSNTPTTQLAGIG